MNLCSLHVHSKQDNYYAQFKFQPKIDQTSNELVVGASTHYELHKVDFKK
jgi:hypothetical protein